MVRILKHRTRTRDKLANFGTTHSLGKAVLPQTPKTGSGTSGDKGRVWEGLGTRQHLSPCCGLGESSLSFVEPNRAVPAFCFSVPVTSWGVMEKTTSRCFVQELFSEQIRQDEAGRFGFNTVDPEVSAAGVVLVPSVCQLEAVRLGVERLPRIHRHVRQVRLPPRPSAGPRAARTPVQAAG